MPVQNLNRPNALGVPAWAQLKYTSVSSNIPMATGDEAQLIIAEADASSNSSNTIAIINAFRAKGNEGNYTGATDAASLLNEVIDQRRRALFLTGTNFGDIVRYKLTLTPATGTNFPPVRRTDRRRASATRASGCRCRTSSGRATRGSAVRATELT